MDIAIITLHKVPNYGSALQAYATQEYIKQLTGANVFIIDYKFPNKYHHKHRKQKSFQQKIKMHFGMIRRYLFEKRRRMDSRFSMFWKEYFNLSSTYYDSVESLMCNPPYADLYVTGSDQVWNVNSLCNDPILYCNFAIEGSKCISFGASFTTKSLPEKYKADVKKWLLKYTAIGVRELSSLHILEDLDLNKGIPIMNTCDPTLLLTANDYHRIAEDSIIKFDEEYIFVYFLSYAYHPEPALSKVIKILEKKYSCRIVVLCDKKIDYSGKFHQIFGIGPCEFVYLFEHAKFVVTSSFHGTMFSVINRKPFITIIPQSDDNDSRALDFLKVVGLEARGIKSNNINPIFSLTDPYTPEVEHNLETFISSSKDFLKNAIYERR